MRIFNADGSEEPMCGNGIRCAAKYAVEKGFVSRDINPIRIESQSGIKSVELYKNNNGDVESVRVDMGTPQILSLDMKVEDGK